MLVNKTQRSYGVLFIWDIHVPARRCMTHLSAVCQSLTILGADYVVKTATGNKKIKLNDWEKEFLLLLTQEENPVFKKVPGAASVGICEGESAKNTTSSKQKGADNMEVEHQPSCSVITSKQPVVAVRKGAKRLSMLETDETRDMSTPKLQRAVLLQQMELQKIQIEKERILLNNLKKTVNDASTDTEDLFSLFD
ncbi:hypothetical protein J6590_037706 [Homalodisca vitripennis]|nr:hypothetical protein J6590_037706 [Homalodisca vitripennis]